MLQSEVFFFITSIAVIILTGLAVGLIVYFYSVVKDLKYVTRIARREADNLAHNLHLIDIPDFLKKIFNRRKKIKVKH
jgi:hypothetical protein